ncbi:MAG: lamin tail domain-containing protein, partial [Methylophilus sp.]|uniref:lamin tail domain-containing protein n=1 Tax=Methylophilus sp. TaxID=29541 RepID=UPI004035E8D3
MRLKPLVSFLAAAFAAPAVLASANGVVISQVYGGNGNVYKNDYVELFNAGAAPVALGGMSVQYASATGTGNFVAVPLTSVTLQPGQYYLVKLGPTSATGADLITADATGTTDLSGTNGKVILASQTGSIGCNGGSNVCNASQLALIVDLLGYGTANFFEGAASIAATSATSLFRAANGCTDSDDNASDFSRGTPAPRNTSTPLNLCGGGGGGNAPIVPSCP